MSSPYVWGLLVLSLLPPLALFLPHRSRARVGHKPLVAAALVLALVLPALAGVAAETWFSDGARVIELLPYSAGALALSAVLLLANWAGEDSPSEAAFGAAGAVALLFLAGQEGTLATLTSFSSLLGMSAAGLAWASLGYRRAAVPALAAMGCFVLVAGLAAHRTEGWTLAVPLAVGFAAAGAGSLGAALGTKQKGWSGLAVAGLLAALGVGLYLYAKGAPVGRAGLILAGTAVMGLVTDFALPQDSRHKVVASVLWLSAAAVGFGLLAGLGVAVAAFGAVTTLLALRRSDLIPTVSPLIGFAAYRLFLEGTEGAKAFDIGQAYALIGLMLGFLIVSTAVSFLQGKVVDCMIPLTKAALTGILLAGGLLLGGLLLQDKGLVGIMVGASAAGVFTLSAGKGPSLAATGLGIASASAAALAFRALLPSLDLTREAKQTALIIFAVVCAAALVALLSLERPKEESSHA